MIELGIVDEWCCDCGKLLDSWPSSESPECLPAVGTFDRSVASKSCRNPVTLRADRLPVGRSFWFGSEQTTMTLDYLDKRLRPKRFEVKRINNVTKVRRVA